MSTPAQAVSDSTRAKLLFESDVFWARASIGHDALEARKLHLQRDYTRTAEPILLEIQQREQDILEYLSRDLEQRVAS